MKRFEFYLQQIEQLLAQAAGQKNPGLWLYKNNFRTPLFMLEALSKMYASFYSKKKLVKLKERFKFLEDLLGGADFYDSFAKEFEADKTIPGAAINYLRSQLEDKITSLNSTLGEKKWLKQNKRVAKIKSRLEEIAWETEEAEIERLHGYYKKEIAGIVDFIQTRDFHFENIETDVHELRRKLRWLSIYPQALRGSIQLIKNEPVPEHLGKYLTPEIVNSPFNKMPEVADNKKILLLEQNYFLALSWMIAELGKIKDKGLQVLALQEAVQKTEGETEAGALKRAYEWLGSGQPAIGQLLKDAEGICRTYFSKKNLENLVLRVVTAEGLHG